MFELGLGENVRSCLRHEAGLQPVHTDIFVMSIPVTTDSKIGTLDA